MFIKVLIAYLVLLLGSQPLIAVADELEQPLDDAITLESDAGFYDEKQGLSIYTGQVVIKQGNMTLEADKVSVFSKDRDIYKLIATGKPVKFTQTPEEGKEDVHGHSLVMEYKTKIRVLIMTQQAQVWQGENSTASERIVYDRISEIIKAGDESLVNQRVHVILRSSKDIPDKNNELGL